MRILYWLLTVALSLSDKIWIHGYMPKCAHKFEECGKKKIFINRSIKKRKFNRRDIFIKNKNSLKWKDIKNEEYERKSESESESVKNSIIYEKEINEKKADYTKLKSKALKRLYERELIHYISDIKNVDNILFLNENEKDKRKRKTVYVGFDLSCKYLHIGNLVPLKSLSIIRRYNTDVIILLGTSTTKIGDPSFQKEERKKSLDKEICENEKEIRKTVLQILLQNETSKEELEDLIEKSNFENENEFIYTPRKSKNSSCNGDSNLSNTKCSNDDRGSLIIVKNNLWYDHINIIDFLKYGEYFSINKLLRKECFLTKMQKKLTLKDFNYLTLQAYDFLYLFQKYNTAIQLGGSDQWGNIQSGIELCQNVFNTQLFGITTKLLLHKNNVKYSKSLFEETKKLPIWISKEKNPPFLFWNFFRNIEDEKVELFLKMLTDVEVKKEEKMEKEKEEKKEKGKEQEHKQKQEQKKEQEEKQTLYESKINEAKKKLADYVTAYVYGDEVVHKINKIKEIAKINCDYKIQNIKCLKVLPFVEIRKEDLYERKTSIIEILKKLEIANSNKDAKNKIIQKFIYLNDEIITDTKFYLKMENFIKTDNGKYLILRVGKKTFCAVLLK